MPHATRTTRIGPLVVLAIAATLMAEFLTGSTPLSRAYELGSELIMYGSGVIVIRETVRRLHLGWASILLLGMAYGLTEEGLVLQSVFNPHFLGLDNSFGRMAGVNWVWAEFITGLHCFWSITGSIIVTELIFFKKKQDPWLSKTGLWITGVIFAVICIAMHRLFVQLFHFTAAPLQLVALAVVVAAVIFLALRLSPAPAVFSPAQPQPSRPFWMIALVTLLASAAWFLGLAAVFSGKNLGPLWIFLAGPVLLGVYFYVTRRLLSLDMSDYTQRLAIATGLLASELIWGYWLTRQNSLDHYAQILCIILIALMVYFLHRHGKQPALSLDI
jgi:hypothetical protein